MSGSHSPSTTARSTHLKFFPCFMPIIGKDNEDAERKHEIALEYAELGGLHPCPVGTVSEVADVIQECIENADIDGCNIGSVTNPGSWTDVVELLVPELQRRGLY